MMDDLNLENENTISAEVRAFVREKESANEAHSVDWMTTELLQRKSEAVGVAPPFYLYCARKVIKDFISKYISKYDAKRSAFSRDEQIILPGFEHLQKAYTVMRQGQQMLVPISLMTVVELEERAGELELMAKGCVKHAREIRAFIRNSRLAG